MSITLKPTKLPAATVGEPYDALVSADGGALPYAFSALGLPQGLRMMPGGAIRGTPVGAAGDYAVELTAHDANSDPGVAIVSLTLEVAAQPEVAEEALPEAPAPVAEPAAAEPAPAAPEPAGEAQGEGAGKPAEPPPPPPKAAAPKTEKPAPPKKPVAPHKAAPAKKAAAKA